MLKSWKLLWMSQLFAHAWEDMNLFDGEETKIKGTKGNVRRHKQKNKKKLMTEGAMQYSIR